jgi:parafibromin
VPSKADAAFVKRLRTSGTEIILRTRNDALHGSHPWLKQTDFTSLRQSLAPTIEAARKVAGADSASSRPSAQAAVPSRGGPKRRADPIIMLSNSPTSLINMFNVKALLEEGIFIDPTQARMTANGQSESLVSIFHHSTNGPHDPNAKPLRFIVVDNADALSRLGGSGGQDVWSRVVAVFTTGQTWQFKAYKWSEPRELFRHGERY